MKDPVSNAVGFKSRWSSLSSDEEFSLEENETTYADDVAKTKIVKDPDEKIENKDKQENMVLSQMNPRNPCPSSTTPSAFLKMRRRRRYM